MKKLVNVLLVTLVFALLGGCVSTTTGDVKPEPDEAEAAIQYYELGARYYRNGNYEFARDRLLRALEFDPKMAIAHSTLALSYDALENPRLAIEHYELAVKYEPTNVDVRNALAVYLCQQKEFDKARENFDIVIGTYANDEAYVAMTNAGVCMAAKPDFALAEQYFRDALKFRSTYGEALLQLSALKFRTEDYLRARAFLQRYMSNNQVSPSVLYLAVQIEQAQGDDRAATDFMNELLRDFPESAEARYVVEAGLNK